MRANGRNPRFRARRLRGKTLGLVGFGRVGSEVARRALALEMKVLAYDPYVTPAAARELEVELLPLDELLRRSDVISLHSSLSPATEKMIDAAAIAKMKKGARLINCARGELIDEVALAEALRSGHLAGAGLDTFAAGAAEELSAHRDAERDCHAAYRRFHARGAGRSGDGNRAAGSRLSR